MLLPHLQGCASTPQPRPSTLHACTHAHAHARAHAHTCTPCPRAFPGGCNYAEALEYIKFKFRTTRKDKEKQLFIFETTATDTANMTNIISSMIEIVQNENLSQCGFG